MGRFAIVEGTVVSVREVGSTIYVNFGRRGTDDFAVALSKRTASTLEASGLVIASLRNRRVRVRGIVDRAGGPRIEVTHVGQIDILAAGEPRAMRHASERDAVTGSK
jgi:hypothetical protein